jgi:3-dehydroquinate dehydratase/shikimate dehydrogenase
MIMYETERLILREWQDKDFEPFFVLNQDHDVMEFFPDVLSYQETIDLIAKFKNKFKVNGFSFYTCELKDTRQFIGSIGLNIPDFIAHFTPCVEIGWRVAKEFWGQGLAVEAAEKCLEIGFTQFNLDEIVSFTAKINTKSARVMQKLGMTYDESDDFYHPKLPKKHPLSLHVLYRIHKDQWHNTHNTNR